MEGCEPRRLRAIFLPGWGSVRVPKQPAEGNVLQGTGWAAGRKAKKSGWLPGRRARRGAAIAEFVLVVPALFIVVMAIAEFGTMFSEYLILHQGAREGARQAALGSTLSTIRSRVRTASYTGVTDTYITVDRYNTSTSAWVSVANQTSGTANDAPTGSLVRVRIASYPHRMVTGTFFSWLPTYTSGGIPMSAQVIMRRE